MHAVDMLVSLHDKPSEENQFQKKVYRVLPVKRKTYIDNLPMI